MANIETVVVIIRHNHEKVKQLINSLEDLGLFKLKKLNKETLEEFEE